MMTGNPTCRAHSNASPSLARIPSDPGKTGTPAFFVHPSEASHGDLGMITADDIVLLLSNSGETDELVSLVPHFKRQGAKLIALTGNEQSSLPIGGGGVLIAVPYLLKRRREILGGSKKAA